MGGATCEEFGGAYSAESSLPKTANNLTYDRRPSCWCHIGGGLN